MNDTDAEYAVPEDVMFRDLGGEAVLLNVTTGRYFGLDEMATRMWQLIASEGCMTRVVEVIVEEYEIDPETAGRDLAELVTELVDHQLLNSTGASTEIAPAEGVGK